ncbi:MAG: hypothetical protein C4334_15255 [Pyrinomonas sp.]|uniref:class I SAM-dependent methyltransferase n=1 Tax=Pyrinomonas sp. TaxID=2080306 RepID=UPI00333100F7
MRVAIFLPVQESALPWMVHHSFVLADLLSPHADIALYLAAMPLPSFLSSLERIRISNYIHYPSSLSELKDYNIILYQLYASDASAFCSSENIADVLEGTPYAVILHGSAGTYKLFQKRGKDYDVNHWSAHKYLRAAKSIFVYSTGIKNLIEKDLPSVPIVKINHPVPSKASASSLTCDLGAIRLNLVDPPSKIGEDLYHAVDELCRNHNILCRLILPRSEGLNRTNWETYDKVYYETPQEIAYLVYENDVSLLLSAENYGEVADPSCYLMAAANAVIGFENEWRSELPDDSIIKIESAEAASTVVGKFLELLLYNSFLITRLGQNAARHIRASHNPSSTVNALLTHLARITYASGRASRRFPKVKGIDYKEGARRYLEKLDPNTRYYLFTKPFGNLANKNRENSTNVIDAETRRYFCDFANLVDVLNLPAGKKVLDVGCGSGWLCEFLARLGYDVLGIDINRDLIRIARARIESIPYGSDLYNGLKCRFLVHDIETSFLPEKFDAAICYDSFHHFENERAVLKHIREMLAPNGLLFILEGACPPLRSEEAEELKSTMLEHRSLESPFNRAYLQSLLIENGFAVIGDFVSINGMFERQALEQGFFPPYSPEVNYLLCKKIENAKILLNRNLRAYIRLLSDWTGRFEPNAVFRFQIEVENAGDCLWISNRTPTKGMVRIGIRIVADTGEIYSEIHGEPPLPRSMAPGEKTVLSIQGRAPRETGKYLIKVDMLAQDTCWFAQCGSSPLLLPLEVI